MRELYAICGYTDTFDKSSFVIKNNQLLKQAGEDTLLVNHFPVDPIIYKDFDFYLYDKNNLLLTEDKNKPWGYKVLNNFMINSRMITGPYHAYAALRLFFNAIQFAKAMQYDVLHMIEYDCEIQNLEEFKDNTKIISEGYNGVCYKAPNPWMDEKGRYWNGEIVENLISFNLHKVNNFKYEEESIIKDLRDKDSNPEKVMHDYFVKDSNFYWKKESSNSINWGKVNYKLTNAELGLAVSQEKDLILFYDLYEYDGYVQVILDDQHFFNFKVTPQEWKTQNLGKITNYSTAKIIYNNKIHRVVDLTNPEMFHFYNSIQQIP